LITVTTLCLFFLLQLNFSFTGAKVILSSRRVDQLEEVKKRLETADSGKEESRVAVLPFDVTNVALAEQNVENAFTIFNSVDIIVLSAGISNRGSVLRTDFSVHEKVMQVNFFGPAALSKAILPKFLEKGGGQYIAISSVQGKFGQAMRSPYAASKHAMQGFFESLRCETAHENMKVLIVSPGHVRTNLSINAVTTNANKKHNVLDPNTAEGFAPWYVADKILQAMANGEEELVVAQGKAKAAMILKRFAPDLLSSILKKRGKAAMREEEEALANASE